MDLDAGRIATGQATVEEVGQEIFERILQVARVSRPRANCWAGRRRVRPLDRRPHPVTRRVDAPSSFC